MKVTLNYFSLPRRPIFDLIGIFFLLNFVQISNPHTSLRFCSKIFIFLELKKELKNFVYKNKKSTYKKYSVPEKPANYKFYNNQNTL